MEIQYELEKCNNGDEEREREREVNCSVNTFCSVALVVDGVCKHADRGEGCSDRGRAYRHNLGVAVVGLVPTLRPCARHGCLFVVSDNFSYNDRHYLGVAIVGLVPTLRPCARHECLFNFMGH